MSAVLIGVLVYLLIQFVTGVVVSRHIASESDYLLAGRRLGLALGAFSVFATWFGAETIVGAAGAIYDEGLAGGSADPFGYGVCLLLLGVLRIARVSGIFATKVTTESGSAHKISTSSDEQGE